MLIFKIFQIIFLRFYLTNDAFDLLAVLNKLHTQFLELNMTGCSTQCLSCLATTFGGKNSAAFAS